MIFFIAEVNLLLSHDFLYFFNSSFLIDLSDELNLLIPFHNFAITSKLVLLSYTI